MAVGDTYFESDGKSVTVALLETKLAGEVTYAEGWLGINVAKHLSGEDAAMRVDHHEVQVIVPTALEAAKGDTIYIDTAQVTVNTPDDAAYSKTAGSGKIPFVKVTQAQDANDVVLGILIVL